MSNKNSAKTSTAKRKPVVLMSMGAQERKGHDYQVMTHKYITPLVEIAGCVPVLVPTCCGTDDLEQYLDMADGVYLTGAGSNIDPTLYGQENLTPEKGQDRDRDLFDLPLIKAAIARGLPVFGICRGMQEINVALGGDIHQKVYAEPGFNDHRENPEDPVAVQYAEAHKVRIEPNSWLARVLGRDEIGVNSLHGQGIKTLGKGLEHHEETELSYSSPDESGEVSKSEAKPKDKPFANVGRNQKCPCGSGKKFKNCHGAPGRVN